MGDGRLPLELVSDNIYLLDGVDLNFRGRERIKMLAVLIEN